MREGSPTQDYPVFEDLCANCFSVVRDCLAFIKRQIDAGHEAPTYRNYPSLLGHEANEFRVLRMEPLTNIPQYTRFLKTGFAPSSELLTDDFQANHEKLLDGVMRDERLKRWLPSVQEEEPLFVRDDRSSVELGVSEMLGHLVERHIHLFGLSEPKYEDFLRVYTPLERGYFQRELPVEYVIPIALTSFGVGRFQVAENVSVASIEHDLNLARLMNPIEGVHPNVVAGASHALIISGHTVSHDQGLAAAAWTPYLGGYPEATVDAFFTAFRLATGVQTGYAQVLCLPIGWATEYHSSLPPVYPVALVRKYPPRFEGPFYGLDEDIPIVFEDGMAEVSNLYKQLTANLNPKLQLAARRLSACYLRDSPEDVVLDATIGLEALLGDGQRGEMTYKLSVRSAALLGAFDATELSLDVARHIKKIYSYRSAIVHGSSSDRSKIVRLANGGTVPTEYRAVNLLSRILRTLLLHPDYLDVTKIDDELLINHPVTGD